MTNKRILVCDDDALQYELIENLFQARYDVFRSTDYREVLNDLRRFGPVHLLLLDLGFPRGEYVGQTCLPEVVKKFPALKVIVRSDILTRLDRREESLTIARELLVYPQVVGFLSTNDLMARIEFEIDKALGTPRWLRDGEAWILHLSDLQFGGDGLPETPRTLATKIEQTLQSFVRTPDESLPSPARLPFICLMTGDLTERARPDEFSKAYECASELSSFMLEQRHDMAGLTKANVLTVPGNHDVSWDILRAQNLHRNMAPVPAVTNEPLVYRHGRDHVDSDLGFLLRHSWLPYEEMDLMFPHDDPGWAWDPGFRVVNLKSELGIVFGLLNSSRWGVDHLEQVPMVPEETWISLGRALDTVDPDSTALRLLLVHHTLTEGESVANRLCLSPTGADSGRVVDVITRGCNFAAVFTGHVHELFARAIDTGSDQKKLIHVGAGTVRSADTQRYVGPQFNLIRIGGRSPDSDKFGSLTVYPFHWDRTRFAKQTAFGYGMTWWRELELKY